VLRFDSVNAPKLVLHAFLAGLYGAVLLARFLWIANDGAARGGRAAALLLIVLVYGAAAGVIWPLLYGAVRFFATRKLRLSWFSPRYLMAFYVVNTAAVLGGCWATVSEFRMVLDAAAGDRLKRLLLAASLAWLYAATITIVPRLRRTAWLHASAAGLVLAALLTPAWGGGAARPRAARAESYPHLPSPTRRLILLNFDGADLEDLLTLLAQGKLPAFARLKEEGAFGRVSSIIPCEAAVTRTVLATGKFPVRNGVRGPLTRQLVGGGTALEVVPVRLGFDLIGAPFFMGRRLDVSDRTVLALWDIAARAGGTVEAAGWDRDLDRGTPRDEGPAEPDPSRSRVGDLLEPEAIRDEGPAAAILLGELQRAVSADAPVLRVFDRALQDRRAGVLALSFPGLDLVAHAFLRYARPGEFGNVSAHEIRLYGGVLEGYYRRVDDIVGRAIAASDRDTVLFVTASHGIDPAPLWRRLVAMASGREWRSGTHHRAPGGFLFVRGPEVPRGVQFGRGQIADIVPTGLYALGMPIASDLDGSIRAGVFTQRYTFEHPVTVIVTYETDDSPGLRPDDRPTRTLSGPGGLPAQAVDRGARLDYR
jgi:hypothetical protein